MHLVCAAQIVYKDLKRNVPSFENSIGQDAVAPSLITLVRMILDGPSIKHQSETAMSTSRALFL